jgi:hypothetical protein
MKPQKPKEPEEFIWVETNHTEETLTNKSEELPPDEDGYCKRICVTVYEVSRVADDWRDSAPTHKRIISNFCEYIVETIERKRIPNPNYLQELEQYKKDLKIYQEYYAKINEKKKLAKMEKESMIKQLQTLDSATLQNIIENLCKTN